MEKKLTTFEIKTVAEELLSNWDEIVKTMKLNSKAMYYLIDLKKKLQEEGQKVTDAMVETFKAHDCKMNDNQTGFIIPDDIKDEVIKEIDSLYQEEIVLHYHPIEISNKDEIPPLLMELLFNFIEFKE